jgi:gamma-glutamylcyclotransferase (GGCT)/AIG2-like uncharacterized protein YtfP
LAIAPSITAMTRPSPIVRIAQLRCGRGSPSVWWIIGIASSPVTSTGYRIWRWADSWFRIACPRNRCGRFHPERDIDIHMSYRALATPGTMGYVKAMSDQRTVLLFSYGTLQLDEVQLSSFGRLLEGQADAMVGYSQSLIEITDPDVIRTSGKRFHPIVEASDNPGDEVKGRVFRITDAELKAADDYEVSDYKRIEVLLRSGSFAWVYVRA